MRAFQSPNSPNIIPVEAPRSNDIGERFMGYTRYWRRPPELDAARFIEFTRMCESIVHEFADTIANTELDGEHIHLEGQPNCEPLVIERVSQGRERDGLVTEFCKTQRLPYDAAVERCLQALAAVFPEVELPPPS